LRAQKRFKECPSTIRARQLEVNRSGLSRNGERETQEWAAVTFRVDACGNRADDGRFVCGKLETIPVVRGRHNASASGKAWQ